MVIGALGVTSLALPATADDHRPPRITLERGEKSQRGRLGSYCWIRPSNGGFLEECGDSDFSFQSGLPARGKRFTLVIHRDTEPDSFEIHRWKRVGKRGRPKGEAIPVQIDLHASTEGSETVWSGRFWIPDHSRHAYLRAWGTWADEDTGFTQDAEWFFHVRRPTAR